MHGDQPRQVFAANHIGSLCQVAQQLQVIKFAVAQVHQLAAGKQFLDGIDGALGLLQMVGKGQDVSTLRGEQPVAVAQLREGGAQGATPLDDQRLEQLIAPGVVVADGNQVLFALMPGVVEDRDIMSYIGPAVRADQLRQSGLHRPVQRRQRDVFMIEEPIGPAGEGLLCPVGGAEHAKAIGRLALEQRLKQQGGARPQAFVGQRGILEQGLEVYHAQGAEHRACHAGACWLCRRCPPGALRGQARWSRPRFGSQTAAGLVTIRKVSRRPKCSAVCREIFC